MSISSAFNAAVSGLGVSGRLASTVSANIANATTEGYGARRLMPAALVVGGEVAGVRTGSVERLTNPVLIGQRRDADANLGQADARASFFAELETLIGEPGMPGSLAERLDRFELSLIGAANRPDNDPALSDVVFAANSLTDKLNDVSDGIQDTRARADADIASSVRVLNDTLVELDNLNRQILSSRGTGGDGNGLLDQQQVLVDRIADLVPVRERRTESGTLVLYSQDGVALLDGPPASFGFDATPIITPDMTLGSGALSPLTVNGGPVPQNGSLPGLSGGRLGALFSVRDDLAVTAQTRLDAFARDLAERFEDPAVDPTRAVTDPGLFTDGGVLTDALNEEGLAGRISLNALVDPGAGGDLWRLRDGLGAAMPGAVGDATILQNMIGTLDDGRITVSGGFSAAARSLSDLGAEMLSLAGTDRQAGDSAVAFASARQTSLRDAELAGGVNTDAELQKMLMIEKMFAANARVIQTASEMLDTLMGLGR